MYSLLIFELKNFYFTEKIIRLFILKNSNNRSIEKKKNFCCRINQLIILIVTRPIFFSCASKFRQTRI